MFAVNRIKNNCKKIWILWKFKILRIFFSPLVFCGVEEHFQVKCWHPWFTYMKLTFWVTIKILLISSNISDIQTENFFINILPYRSTPPVVSPQHNDGGGEGLGPLQVLHEGLQQLGGRGWGAAARRRRRSRGRPAATRGRHPPCKVEGWTNWFYYDKDTNQWHRTPAITLPHKTQTLKL